MKAILIKQFGGAEQLQIGNVSLPCIHEHHVKVKLHAAGINPSDVYTATGTYAVKPNLPYTPGNDGAGVVVEVGADVKGVKVGDRVFVVGGKSKVFTGTMAAEIVCEATAVHPLPEHISFEQGAGLGVPALTAYRALVDRAQLKAGQTVFIHGASGAVGLIAVQMAKHLGATVIGTASREEGKALVKEAGADIVLDHITEETVASVLDVTNGEEPDVIIEFLANVNLQADLMLVKKRGVIVVIGNRGDITINPRLMMQKECDVRGMVLWNMTQEEYEAVTSGVTTMLQQQAFAPVVRQAFPFEEASAAFQEVIDGTGNGKVVVTMEGL